MVNRILQCLAAMALFLLGRQRIASGVSLFISACARRLPSVDALRLLFDLDMQLYAQQGEYAVSYGDGIHPKHRLTRYHDFFSSRVNPSETVLDVGCGIGAVAYSIAVASKCTITGIDLDEENIRRAIEKYQAPGLTFRQGNALCDLPEGHFDVVILSNVLEHLPDRIRFLTEIVRTVTPKRLLLRVPLFERDWRVSLKKELGLEWRLDPTHLTEYTLESFLDEVAGAHLLVAHMEVRWGEIWCELCPVT